MAGNVDWDKISDFERHEKLVLKQNENVTGTFCDDGNFVPRKVLEESKAKYPRDSYVFVIEVNGSKKEFWVSTSSHSTMRQLKRVRETNNGTLEGLKVSIKRISEEPTKQNYEIKPFL